MIAAFCERLFWSDYSVLFMRINEKLNWCVKEELMDLMQLPSLRPERARALYLQGVKTVDAICKLKSIDDIVKCFNKAEGFQSHRRDK